MRAHKLLIVTLIAACGGRTTSAPRSPQPVATDAVLAKLTTRQKVAQLVVPWLGGNYMALDDSAFQIATRWIDTLEVGGIIISVGSPYDIAAKLNTLQRRSKLPLLVSADLEWGAAMRVVGATAFPYIMATGATGDERDAYTIGRVAALEGRAVGIHVNFAPDADVNNNPLNPIINTRSFGEDPRAVARLVRAYVRGLQDNGMLATLKHFPGHGDTDADSHLGLPTIRVDYARLDSVELVPFRAGIDAGAQVVMSAHIAFPAFTGETPATLSAAMLTGVLRDSLKFKGLVVTDALQMGAIVAKYGAGEAAVRAFEAGSDLLLMPADPDSAIASMLVALQTGRLSGARLDSSVSRVLAIKRQLGLFERRTVPLDSIARIVGSKSFQDAADDIAQRSLTLVRDTSGIVARLITVTDSVKPTVLVSLGSPYLLNQTPTVKSYLIAWSGVRPAERAAARVLLGWSPVRGKLPIRIPPAYPIGHGLTIADSTLAPVKPPAHVIVP